MKELLKTTVEHLRFHVMRNLELVRENEREIKEIRQEPISIARVKALSDKYDYSKKILSENNDFINLQLSIINFIYKYNQFWEMETELAMVQENKEHAYTKDECFQLTIESKIDFGPSHPYFNDESFFCELLQFYQQQEDYEKCHDLVVSKKME